MEPVNHEFYQELTAFLSIFTKTGVFTPVFLCRTISIFNPLLHLGLRTKNKKNPLSKKYPIFNYPFDIQGV